jgi:tetratricopeptide (TPR) repeat protein
MTNEQLIYFMQHPWRLNQETLPLLKELTELNPAFELGWMLLLKNLKNMESPDFLHELLQGAIRVHDRQRLYNLLNRKEDSTETLSTEQSADHENEWEKLLFSPEYHLETEISSIENLSSLPPKENKTLSLIDKFLEAQPKMPPINDKSETTATIPEHTENEMEEDFITETLASIYTQQGYYKKAIAIYEKLSLNYPEKSTYFAALIQKINHLMNN